MTSSPPPYRSAWRDDEVVALGDLASRFVASELVDRRETWEAQHYVGREVWHKAGDLGLLCCGIPEQYGGGGGSYAHDLAVIEAQARQGDSSFGNLIHSGIVAQYLLRYGNEEQRQRWLPAMSRGELIGAIAMTEPSGGSDLKALRTRAERVDDTYVINGSKTFISNGHTADLIIVAARTGREGGVGDISLIVVETDGCQGLTRGQPLAKLGQTGADTTELFFDDLRVPAANLLGETEGQGFAQLMAELAQERLGIGILAVGMMERTLEITLEHVKQRDAFGQKLFDFQHIRFTLAECATTIHTARVFLDSCIDRHLGGGLDGATAAMAKWWLTEQQCRVVDECVQMFGGYGYVREYPIARLYADARVQKVYGGANEIMKELVARSL